MTLELCYKMKLEQQVTQLEYPYLADPDGIMDAVDAFAIASEATYLRIWYCFLSLAFLACLRLSSV